MRSHFIIICLLFLSLCGMGCLRISREMNVEKNLPPPYRLYSGTRSLIGLPFSMAIMGSVSHAPSSSNAFNTILPMTLFVLDFPLEIAADTIILPVDLWLYGYYCRNHPLDRHLYSNDLEGLEKKLKKGVSPNVISPWFMKRQPLLCQAYWNHNETAYLFIGFQFI